MQPDDLGAAGWSVAAYKRKIPELAATARLIDEVKDGRQVKEKRRQTAKETKSRAFSVKVKRVRSI